MARMPAGQPRSVPDPEGEAYEEMLRRERLKRNRAEQSVGHPGFAESLIPVWGSGREAVADFQEGDYAGAALNAGLAASDVFLAGAAGKALVKTVAKAATTGSGKKVLSTTWNATRKRMQRSGYLPPGQQGHHWLIPQNGWGKPVPEAIKNSHWNIMPRSPEVHGRIHHRVGDLPRYSPAERFVYGTPTTVKVVAGSAAGHPAAAGKAYSEGK